MDEKLRVNRPEMLVDLTLPRALEQIKNSVRVDADLLIHKDLDATIQVEKARENLVKKKRQKQGKGKSL